MTKQETARRLTVWADYLEHQVKPLGEEKFDMSTWWETRRSCGTAGCALGWACQIEEFRSLGLVLDIEFREPVFEVLPVAADYDVDDDDAGKYRQSGSNAAAMLFGIELEEARFITNSIKYRDRDENGNIPIDDVIARIRTLAIRYQDNAPPEHADQPLIVSAS